MKNENQQPIRREVIAVQDCTAVFTLDKEHEDYEAFGPDWRTQSAELVQVILRDESISLVCDLKENIQGTLREIVICPIENEIFEQFIKYNRDYDRRFSLIGFKSRADNGLMHVSVTVRAQ